SLETLDRCTNVPLLRAVVQPPADPEQRKRVAVLRERLADLKARFDAGKWTEVARDAPSLVSEARSLGYQPLIAEVLSFTGSVYRMTNDIPAAEKAMVEAFWLADAARHDEVRAEAATNLVFVVGYQQRHFDDAQ